MLVQAPLEKVARSLRDDQETPCSHTRHKRIWVEPNAARAPPYAKITRATERTYRCVSWKARENWKGRSHFAWSRKTAHEPSTLDFISELPSKRFHHALLDFPTFPLTVSGLTTPRVLTSGESRGRKRPHVTMILNLREQTAEQRLPRAVAVHTPLTNL